MTIAIIKRDLQRKITITLPELQADLRHLYSQNELLKNNGLNHGHGNQGRGRGGGRGDQNNNETMLGAYNTQVKSNCNLCGNRGHKSVDCWDHPRNANKRPGFYKGPKNLNDGKDKAVPMVDKNKVI